MKVLNSGRRIEGLPAPAVLDDEAVPAAVTEARASWREAVAALVDPASALAAAEREAGERIVRVRGERERFDAEVRAATREERSSLQVAERAATVAAQALVAALDEHAEEVRAIAARLALLAHVRAVDAMVEQRDEGAEFARIAPRVAPSDLSRMGTSAPRTPARSAGSVLSGLEPLDLVNVGALLEIAGAPAEDFGLVEIYSTRSLGARILTTPRRAVVLVGRRGSGSWQYASNEEVPA